MWYMQERKNDHKWHLIYHSIDMPGRFSLEDPEGFVLSTNQPVQLWIGKYILQGRIETTMETSWFIPDGGSFKDSRIALQEKFQVSLWY